MYGLVNQAVQDLVISQFGEDIWQEIKTKSGTDVDVFLSMEPYDDAITYNLVGAAVEVLDMPAEDILHAFGEYWVLETATKSYGELMTAGGRTLPEFLANLDQLHSRVRMTFPNLRPPSFRTVEKDSGTLHLHYYSEREGLEPFVVGLIHGLGKRFGVTVDMKLLSPADGGAEDHAEFVVHHSSPPTE